LVGVAVVSRQEQKEVNEGYYTKTNFVIYTVLLVFLGHLNEFRCVAECDKKVHTKF
jgi:hypothetical protein